jgi:hypothetical protein
MEGLGGVCISDLMQKNMVHFFIPEKTEEKKNKKTKHKNFLNCFLKAFQNHIKVCCT